MKKVERYVEREYVWREDNNGDAIYVGRAATVCNLLC